MRAGTLVRGRAGDRVAWVAGATVVSAADVSGVVFVSVVVRGGGSVATGDGGVLVVAGWVVAGVSCAHDGVEESAKTAAIAAAPARAYSLLVVLIMERTTAKRPWSNGVIAVSTQCVDQCPVSFSRLQKNGPVVGP